MKDILVIEDDPDLSTLLELELSAQGHSVRRAATGTKGLELATKFPHRLVILDLKLPGLDGREVCRRLRALKSDQLILMLTSLSDDADKLLGFEIGADDYMTKPFNIRELLARVRALLRRGEESTEQPRKNNAPLVCGDLALEPASRIVTKGGVELELTATEFDLLYHFFSHPGETFTRQQLLSAVWEYEFAGYEHTVNSHINRLRSKIESDPAYPKIIVTVWGVGYRADIRATADKDTVKTAA